MENFHGILPAWLMLAMTLLTIVGAAYWSHKHEDYLVAAWIVPLFLFALSYAAAALPVPFLSDDPPRWNAVHEPGEFFLLAFMFLHFLNGHLNAALRELHRRGSTWTRASKSSSRP